MSLVLLTSLFNKLGIIVLAAFLLSKTEFFKGYLTKENFSWPDKLFFSTLFGSVGIIGTYWGIPVNGAIANSRSIGVIIAGFLGGPSVGIGAGLIAGIHRMLIPDGPFTAIPCGISTIIGGIIAGYSKHFVDEHRQKWFWGILITAIIESIQMGLILLLARPFDEALHLVKIIFTPMTVINSLGTGAFLLLFQGIYDDQERAAALKAQLALNIAAKTLPYLRKGLNRETAKYVSEIIMEAVQVDAVSITNTDTILSHIGLGSDHHESGKAIHTAFTKKALLEGKLSIANEPSKIECDVKNCPLKSAIVVPLKNADQVIGALKLYKKRKGAITSSDIELARGLGQLFSTQLELSTLDYQKELLNKAEIKALQAQIQPHFLFNALNTIVAYCRTDAGKARELLLKLSQYLRQSFKNSGDFIDFSIELEYIKNYLSIEEARFGNRLSVVYDIQNEIITKVPPLILQPIVENALKHGIMNAKEGGIITIRAFEQNNMLIMQVVDNGVGMDMDTIYNNYNYNNSQNSEHGGVGLINVNERLKSLYGKELIIDSKPNYGTTVTLQVPIVT